MKKTTIFNPGIFLLITAGLLTGCAETHQEAIASLDLSTMYYNGVSDFRISSAEEQLGNLGYLFDEELSMWDNSSGANLNGAGMYNLASGPSDENRLADPYFTTSAVRTPKNDFFSLSEEIELVGKGYKENSGNGTTNNSLYYLEVPVLMNYHHKIKNGHFLYGGFGIYAASGLFGHYSSTFDGKSTSGSIKFGSTADYDRMDYGIVLKAGYTFSKKFNAFLNYDFGLKNIYSPEDKLFNRSFGINVAYRIK